MNNIQHRLKDGPLLDKNGQLVEAGFSFSLNKEYNRKQIKGLKSRIKEWDYYYIGNKDYGVAFTIADNSYMWLVGASFLDFKNKTQFTKNQIGFFSFGKLHIPNSSKNGDLSFRKKHYQLTFKNDNGKRQIVVHFDCFGEQKKPFDVDIKLDETNEGSMVIATPFKKKKHFYYNQKINLLKASGTVKFNDKIYDFNNAYGVLDWGRGIWTYKNTWYWCSVNAIYKGKRIGFNLGYGFGDTSNASENMFFYDDKAYKLNDVKFEIPQKDNKDDYLGLWKMTSNSGDIQIVFTPILDRFSDSNVLLIRSRQHQVFGRFSGIIKTTNKEILFEDIPGFAEKVYNRW